MERCWATPTSNSEDETPFDLIQDGCSNSFAKAQGLDVSVNGDQTYGRFEVPVFKFVSYSAVWLHCDLQICIAEPCQPQCSRRRRRDAFGGYGPNDWDDRIVLTNLAKTRSFFQFVFSKAELYIENQAKSGIKAPTSNVIEIGKSIRYFKFIIDKII